MRRMHELMTVKETAGLLRMHPKTVSRLLKSGKLPGQKFGDDWRVQRTLLLAHGFQEPVAAPRVARAVTLAEPVEEPAVRPGRKPRPARAGSARAALRQLDPYADLRAS